MMWFGDQHRDAVSPLLVCANTLKVMGPAGKEVDVQDEDVLEDEVPDVSKYAVLGEPIVGRESVTYSEKTGQGALQVKPLPSPKEPTAAEKARHNITHLPYAS